MELEYFPSFPTPYKGARKEGIMLSEASISLYFECPKKGARKGQASSVTAIKFLYNIIFHVLRYMRVNA